MSAAGQGNEETRAMHDLVIRNACVFDGLGNDPVEGSIGVRDGRIAEVGDGVDAGKETVDAEGLALSPGIVDIHTHFDAQLTWDPWATPSVALGVTTVVMGNCGFTIAPCRERDRDRTLRNLTHVEGMSLEALLAGVDWDFETYPQYLDMLERKGMVPNVASFVGHSSVRTWALGEEASDRAATKAEVAEMKRLVAEAMDAGAIGFATSTLEQHNGEAGIPMPSRLADEHEMRELTGVLGEAGKGVFMLTKGMTSTIPWLESIAANNGRPVMIAAMFIDPNDPERVFREISEIGEARGRGRELWAQVGCFPLGMEFQLRHPVSAGGVPGVAARPSSRKDPKHSSRMVRESGVQGRAEGGGGYRDSAEPVLLPLLRDPHGHGDHLRQALGVRRAPGRRPRARAGQGSRSTGCSTSRSTTASTPCSTASCSTPTRNG